MTIGAWKLTTAKAADANNRLRISFPLSCLDDQDASASRQGVTMSGAIGA
jgi:hypothetical protein